MNRKLQLHPTTVRAKKVPEVERMFVAAVHEHAGGRLGRAEQLFRKVLALQPKHADSLHRIGLIAYQVGNLELAVKYLSRAVKINRRNAAYHNHLSLALAALGRLEDAARTGMAAARLAPSAADTHVNLGFILMQLGRLDEAAEFCRRAVRIAPDLPEAHSGLGAVLQEMGRSGEAAASYRDALILEPDFPEAHTGLGNALLELGLPQDALEHHSRAIELRTDFVEARYNLGQALRRLGRPEDAEGQFREAIRVDPTFMVAYSNLAQLLKASGRLSEAESVLEQALAVTGERPEILESLASTLLAQNRPGDATRVIATALARRESPSARNIFAQCVMKLDASAVTESFRALLLRALSESWSRPENLARVTLNLIARNPCVTRSMARSDALWPGPVTEAQIFGDNDLLAIADDELLRCLLCCTPNVDVAFERFLTLARQALLERAEAEGVSEVTIGLYSAVARQCFLNEYVFPAGDDEDRRAAALRDRLAEALEGNEVITPGLVLAVGSYFSLSSLPSAERLVERPWHPDVEAVLKQQIVEVRQEAILRADIPRLTAMQNKSSDKVRAQYEDNPYPRWRDAGSSEPQQSLANYLTATFPLSPLQPLSAGLEPDVLIAGCGTGRNALDTARAFIRARILAIDLSAASLAYAVRKTCEACVENVTYAQADLTEIQSLGCSFDLIEAMGVLHHLKDPMAGCRALLAVLRPGGVMRLGLYSSTARRNLPVMGIGEPNTNTIRAARQKLIARTDDQAQEAMRAPDFYTVSGCRDLLFHAEESRLSLGEIDALLREANVSFLGFVLSDEVLAIYRSRFPNDPAAVDFGCWATFEEENPNTFAEMYQFWIQKRRPGL